jgi:autotransporter-associated beta strand protein
MRLACSSYRSPTQFAGVPMRTRAGLRSTASALALATAALSSAPVPARAACSPTVNPTTGQIVTCDSSQPNPVTTAIVAQPGSTNVTVNMLSGAQLNVGSNAIVLSAGGQINNNSGAIIQGTTGINSTGPLTIANDGQIGGTSGPGVVINGAGNSTLTNTGSINGSGTAVQFNTVAGSSQTFNNTGNGSINGNFVGSGDGAIVISNSGNFNGAITISGNGSNSITTASGHNINGQVSISGNSQNTIVNGGAFNNGLVISGAGINSITNQSGAFINQTFSVAGSQNTIDNAGTLNNGLTVSGGGTNFITNHAGATINQTFSVAGSQNTIDNAGTLNNGLTVSGNGINFIANRAGATINQALSVTGNAQSTIINAGTMNNGMSVSGTGSVFNSGTINGGTAINFTSGPGPFTLTIAPSSVINGTVLGTGNDTFQLGGTGAGTFNVNNIGPSQQYQGFSVFNKVDTSTWTLTGTGAQNWTVNGGTLIGDTNSLQGSAITNNAALVFSQGFNGTYAGSIGGSGALTVQGGGTVTFTGANTYSGGTTINGGALRLGNGGASGSIVGDVVDNGTFTINRSDTFTFGGAISGGGAFVQMGTGTTILTGNSSYAGVTTVAAGTLQVSGSIASSSAVTVNSGATLAGTGIVTGQVSSTTINSGGTLAPGNNAVGALLVSGDLTFQSAAQYLVQVSPTSASSTFVTGSTTIAGTLTANALGGSYSNNQIFPVLTSTGGLTGTFNLATTGNFGAGVTLSLAYSAHEVFLLLNAGSTSPSWSPNPATNDWNTGTNWVGNSVPGATEIAQFNNSTKTTISIQQANTLVGALQFNAPAPGYTFLNIAGGVGNPASLIIQGDGVADISGNAPTFVVSGVSGGLGTLQFRNSSTADDAIITTSAFGQTIFSDNSTGGLAQFITTAGGVVDFSGTSGPAGNNRVTAGSIEGAGTYNLGSNTLIVGLNGLSTTVSGTINDGGASGGTGASLIKLGAGTLILSGANTYTGLTAVLAGTLQLGDGGTSGSILGNVFNHTTLAVNRSDTYTFGGIIIGDGQFVQMGPGTTVLTANSFYTGGTTISAGTLQLGSGGASGSIIGNVVDNGTFAINRSDTYTFGGVISGTGSVVQIGSGTTVLTGNNSYGGGTGINAGVLAVAADTNLGATSGSLAFGGGTLQFLAGFSTGRAVTLNAGGGTVDTNGNSATLAGTIGGPGGLTKIGIGTLTLSANNPYTGATTVNAGTLAVNGAIASSAVTVNTGGTLGGTGTVGSTTINGGALSPGNSIGTLTVQGNLVLTAAAAYIVEISPSSADLTNVTGTASLGGTVQAVFGPGSYLTRTYTILSAAGGRNGTFGSLTTPGLPAGFTASLSYTATDAILDLIATLGGGGGGADSASARGPLALNVNQRNVANALNNFFNTGGTLPPNFLPLFNLTGGNLANALTLLSGEPATGAQQVGFQMESQFLNLMLDPFVDGRSGIAGTSGPALGFAPERDEALPDDPRSSSGASVALAYSKALKAPPVAAPTFDQRWTAWGGAYGGGNRTTGDSVIGSHDLSANTAGFAAGLDYRLTPNSVVGLALAGGGTNWSLAQGLGGGKSDAFQAGLYGATRWGPAYLAAAFAFTNHWMSTDRFAFAGDHLTASFNAQSYGGRIESGYRFTTWYGGVTPYAAIQVQSFHTPAYSETDTNGGGFGLSYNSRTGNDTRSELGARFDRVLALYTNAVLSLRARLAWAHDWVSDPTLAPVFQVLPGASFIVNGATPAKNSALASAGTELRIANGVTLLAKFDGEFATHASTYAGTGTVRYTW